MNHVRARLTCWGTRGTCPSPGLHSVRYGGNTSCVSVELPDGSRVILDAGTGIRVAGRAIMRDYLAQPRPASVARPTITVVLTHRHSDHVHGLAHFAPLLSQTHRLHVACNEVSERDVRALITQQLTPPLFPSVGGMIDAVAVDTFDNTDTLRITPTLRVRALMAHHPGGASVLLVEDNHGPLLAYAPDNELSFASDDSTLVEWRNGLQHALHGVPVLVHDATYAQDELGRHAGWGHSSVNEATDFAVACEAGTLLLTHHHPDRTDDEIDALVVAAGARAAAAGSKTVVRAAIENTSIEIL